ARAPGPGRVTGQYNLAPDPLGPERVAALGAVHDVAADREPGECPSWWAAGVSTFRRQQDGPDCGPGDPVQDRVPGRLPELLTTMDPDPRRGRVEQNLPQQPAVERLAGPAGWPGSDTAAVKVPSDAVEGLTLEHPLRALLDHRRFLGHDLVLGRLGGGLVDVLVAERWPAAGGG